MPTETTASAETQSLKVFAPISDPPGSLQFEHMHASQDSAVDDQAVLLNAPFWVDWLNFGDLVRVGPPGEGGSRPILEVVVASGHVRVMAIVGRYGTEGLQSLGERL